MNFVRTLSLSLSLPMLALIAACGGSSAPRQSQPPQTTSSTIVREPKQAPPAPAPEATQPPASSSDQSQAFATLSDNEIATSIAASSMGAIELGRFAKAKAKDPRVKKLAATMISDHTDATHTQVAMMNKLSLKIQENPISMQMMNDDSAVLDALKSQTGPDFDRMYVTAVVKDQQLLLDMIDHKFIPNAKSPDLKAFLEGLRPTVEKHLKDAQAVQTSLLQK